MVAAENWTPVSYSRTLCSVTLKWEAKRVSVTLLDYGAHQILLREATSGSVDVEAALGGVHLVT